MAVHNTWDVSWGFIRASTGFSYTRIDTSAVPAQTTLEQRIQEYTVDIGVGLRF